jgi:hypothetical protein
VLNYGAVTHDGLQAYVADRCRQYGTVVDVAILDDPLRAVVTMSTGLEAISVRYKLGDSFAHLSVTIELYH